MANNSKRRLGERLNPVPITLTGTFGPIIIDRAMLSIFCGVSTGRIVSGRASNVYRYGLLEQRRSSEIQLSLISSHVKHEQ